MLDRYSIDSNIQYVGIALDESERVMKKRESKIFRYPLIEWRVTEADCLNYLKKQGLLNPLYEKFTRLGCFWCPKQSTKSLQILYNEYPDLWERLMEMYRRVVLLRPGASFRIGKSLDELEREFALEKRLYHNRKVLW